jgi:uncharacterized membrane protein YkoI
VETPGRFDELLRLWQDGDASAEELGELDGLLRGDPALRRRLVESTLVESALYSRFARQAAPAPVRRRRTLELAAAGLLLAVSAVAVARLLLIESPRPRWVETVTVSSGRDASTDWARLLNRAPLSLAEAVERALAAANGGTPIEAALEEDDGKVVYTVRVARDGEVREVEIDATDGRVRENEAEGVDASQRAAAPGISLADGIAKALARMPGRAVKAERERKGDGAELDIEIWSLGKLYEVKLETTKEDAR